MGEQGAHSGLAISLLGEFRVVAGERDLGEAGWPSRRARSLVKLLALSPGRKLHREQVIEALWPGVESGAPGASLRKAVHFARHALDPEAESGTHPYLQTRDDHILLVAPGEVRVDVDAFREAASAARRAGDVASYERALSLYGGELLPEDLYEEWTIGPRNELRESYTLLLVEASRLYEAAGDLEAGIDVLRRAVEVELLLEEAQAGLMRLLALSGQSGQALRQYRSFGAALEREVGAEPGEATRRLYEEIEAGRFPASSPSERSVLRTAKRSHNLPAQLTNFIGREKEMAEVKRLLSGTRLLTLTGPGGSGKTRLALEVAATLVDEYPDGVWLVELAALSDPGLVPRAVASVLEIGEQAGRPLVDTLAASLFSKRLVLVLDNCEHLVAACAQLAEAILRACPKLRVLATSREALNIPGEIAWLVPSLSLPDPARLSASETDLAEDLMQYEAIRLFVDRAAAVTAGLRLSDHNASAMAQICRRLDGIPLAIELAAVRVRMLPVQQIAERLDHSFQLLTSGSRTALPRHKTLSAAIDWSYDLLSDKEKALFRRLSVFAGGFTLAAVEAVCGGRNAERGVRNKADTPDIPQLEALDLLSHLVDKSLVVVLEAQGGEARYRLLETLRQYGWGRLGECEEAEEAGRQHADYYSLMCEQAEPELRVADRVEVLGRLDQEYDNIRAALEWYFEHDTQAAMRLAGNLWRFWYRHNYIHEGRVWLDRALGNASEEGEVRAKVLQGAGTLGWLQGDYIPARLQLEESVALWRDLGDGANLAMSLHFLGHVIFDQMDYAGARSLFEESLALYDELADARLSQTLIADLGFVAYHLGDNATARALLEESLTRFRAMGAKSGTANILIRLGDLARTEGDYEAAAKLYQESLDLSRELIENLGIASALHKLGYVARHRGDYDRAGRLFIESLGLQRELGNKQGIIECLSGLAGIALVEGRLERAGLLFGAVSALLESMNVPLAPADRAEYNRDVALARAQMEATSFDAAWQAGLAMTMETAINFTLAL